MLRYLSSILTIINALFVASTTVLREVWWRNVFFSTTLVFYPNTSFLHLMWGLNWFLADNIHNSWKLLLVMNIAFLFWNQRHQSWKNRLLSFSQVMRLNLICSSTIFSKSFYSYQLLVKILQSFEVSGIEVWVFRGAIEKDKIRSWEQNDHSVKFNLGIRIIKIIPFQSTAMIERENNSCNELDGALVFLNATCVNYEEYSKSLNHLRSMYFDVTRSWRALT